ncbi:MAG: hypothetical protein MUF72_10075 [Elainella sp. Prado103]|jgi:hypothetical protein|nr:hypothetical protein [Elainella sp. Prado103]
MMKLIASETVELQVYSRSAQILRRFTAASGNQLISLYEPAVVTPWDRVSTVRYYGFITDFRMKVDISSISEQQLPELSIESSRTERITAVRDMEWKSPRKELELLLESPSHPAVVIASVSLVNRLPYYHVNLMPYFTDNGLINIAAGSRILARLLDAGYGLLQNTDEVVVFGSAKEEATVLPNEPRSIQSCTPYSWTVGTNSTQLLPINPNRLQLTLVNRSSAATVFLNYGVQAQVGQGIALMPGGGSYEINQTNPYAGIITAIADGANATLTGLECI